MKYNLNTHVIKDRHANWFLMVLCAVLSVSTAFFGWLAVRNAQPLNCVELRPLNGFYECKVLIPREEYQR